MQVSQIDASYLRLSLEDDEVMKGTNDESASIVSQRLCINEYVKKHLDVPSNLTEFVDDGHSGTSMEDRPAMKQLLNLVSMGRVRTIIVRDLSRFARNYLEAGHYLEYIFPAYNVRFISINDNYDSANVDDAEGKGFEVAIRNLLNEWYSKDLSRKIKSTVDLKKMRGEYVFGAVPFGYKKGEKKNTIEIDLPAAEIVRRIFEMAVSGSTISKIAKNFNEENVITPSVYLSKVRGKYKTSPFWSYEMVQNILINRIYTGDTVPFKSHVVKVGSKRVKMIPEEEQVVIPDTHEGIITREMFWQARNVIKSNKKTKTGISKNVLSGYLVCGCCGRKLTKGRPTNKNWLCAMARYTDEMDCGKIRLNEQMMKEKLLSAIKLQCRLADATIDVTRSNQAKRISELDSVKWELRKAERESDAFRDQLISLMDRYYDGSISKEQFLEQKTKVKDKEYQLGLRVNELKQKMRDIQKKISGDFDVECNANVVSQHKDIEGLDDNIMKELVEKIVIYPDQTVQIHWNFSI